MLNQVLKVFTGIRQHFVEVLSKSVTFLDFWISQGSVATYCRWGNLCDVYIENFLTNHLVKEFWKFVHICQSYYQTSKGLFFWNTVCIYIIDIFVPTLKTANLLKGEECCEKYYRDVLLPQKMLPAINHVASDCLLAYAPTRDTIQLL